MELKQFLSSAKSFLLKVKDLAREKWAIFKNKFHNTLYGIQFEAKWFYNKTLKPETLKLYEATKTNAIKFVDIMKPKVYIFLHRVLVGLIGLAEKSMEILEPKAESCLTKYHNALNVEAPLD